MIREELAKQPEWLTERFKGVIERLEWMDMTESEQKTLLWLCGCDVQSLENVLSLVEKAGNRKRAV